MKPTLKFPQDFRKRTHPTLPNAVQWVWPTTGRIGISIVGGHSGLYGNGVTTFEMYDLRQEGPQGYLTKEQINEHLKNNPF